MTKKILLDYLLPHEKLALDEAKKSRLKSRDDATFYAAQIKKILDRARARMNKEEKT